MQKQMLLTVLFVLINFLVIAQNVMINEVMSNNAATLNDESEEFSDWIELRNLTENMISLKGYGLSDDPQNPFKWVFEDYYLMPGEYLLIWASDKNLQAGAMAPDQFPETKGWFNAGDIDINDTSQVRLSGNNIFVKKWPASNSMVIAQQSNTDRQPLFIQNATGGNPAVRFDGNSDALVTNLFPPADDSARTIIVVVANADMTNGNQYSNNNIVQYGDYGNAFGLACRKKSSGGYIGTTYWSGTFYGLAVMDSSVRFISLTHQNGQDDIFVNGRFAGTQYNILATGTKFPLHLASRIGNSADQFAGDIAEVIVFNTALTSSNRRRVENYLASRYQLPVQKFHTNFKLSSQEPETIILTRPDGMPEDQLIIPPLPADVSYGRSAGNTGYFSVPTPGMANNTGIFTGIMSPPGFSAEAGFYQDTLTLTLSSDDQEAVILYTLDGSDPDISAVPGKYFPINYSAECNQGEIVNRQSITHVYHQPLSLAPKYNVPNDRSQIPASYRDWESPVNNVFKASVVKSCCWKEGFLPSPIITKTYVVDTAVSSRFHLPVVSVVIPDASLFDYDTGMYVPGKYYDQTCELSDPDANFKHDDWEKPAHFELFDPTGQLQFSQNAGARIHGNFSSNWSRKSLRFEARSRYNDDALFEFPLFPGLRQDPRVGYREIDHFNAFLIRNSGNNWHINLFHDAMVHRLVAHLPCDGQASGAVVHFLNGEYWGIMNLREKHDEHYFAEHYNMDADDIIIANARTSTISSGYQYEYQHYLNAENFVANNSLSDPENYNYLNTQIDIENYLTHFMIEIYVNNTDFLGNNRKFWRKRTPYYMPGAPYGQDGRWRWILYDTDISFENPEYDRLTFTTTGNANSTRILRKLLENESFKNEFINSFCDNMNSTFLPGRIIQTIDSMRMNMDYDIIEHIDRWNNISSDQNCDELIDFAQRRPYFMRQHLKDRFQLSDTCIITLNTDISMGTITINSLAINGNTRGLADPGQPYPWSGTYFTNVPVRLVAQAKPGFRFSHWSTSEMNDTIYLSVASATEVQAYFESAPIIPDPVVINEINYNSHPDFDPGDWAELYNPNDYPVDLSEWIFKDEDDAHAFIFPANTIIEAKGYLVLCGNSDDFTDLFQDVENFIGDMDFGLNGSGELIRLYNKAGALIDSLIYDDISPWPDEPDGNGPTLELIHPELNNSLGQSWMASPLHGTPGAMNSDLYGISDMPADGNQEMIRIYPNPFSGSATIELLSQSNERINEIRLINQFGITVFEKNSVNQSLYLIQCRSIQPGIYYLKVITGGKFTYSRKVVVR